MIAASAPYTRPSRAVARSLRGMVSTPHAAATSAGLDVLRRGGNAVDAAIAANAVLAVVYPASCGIGGDAFWIVYEPRDESLVSYNGSGRAARKLRAASLREAGHTTMPQRGALTVTVPGAVRSWEDVGAAHGSRGLDELLAPAAGYARDGFVATEVTAAYLRQNEALLRAHAGPSGPLWLDGGVPETGVVLRNPELAETLEAVRRGGAQAFYTGATAERIVATLNAGGNPMTLDDLAEHTTERTVPLRMGWNGGELVTHAPNSHGATMLMTMGMLAHDRDASPERWNHLAIEAVKIAFAQRDAYFGDPHHVDIPIETFLSNAWLDRARSTIDPERAKKPRVHPNMGDTIYLCVVDGEGRAVSLIESLYMNFGAALAAEGTGIFLQNRGAYFSLQEGHANELIGGRRPLHTLAPAMFLRDGKPELVFGTMGGDGQPQIQTQFLHQYFDCGLDLQQALDEPRWVFGKANVPGRPELLEGGRVIAESRMPQALLESLSARGHAVATIGPYEHTMGHAHAIAIDRARGTLAGAADPRADSAALGL